MNGDPPLDASGMLRLEHISMSHPSTGPRQPEGSDRNSVCKSTWALKRAKSVKAIQGFQVGEQEFRRPQPVLFCVLGSLEKLRVQNGFNVRDAAYRRIRKKSLVLGLNLSPIPLRWNNQDTCLTSHWGGLVLKVWRPLSYLGLRFSG